VTPLGMSFMANGGESECRTSTTLAGRGQGRSSTNAVQAVLERAREWVWLQRRNTHLRGLPRGGVGPGDLLPPAGSPGQRPRSGDG